FAGRGGGVNCIGYVVCQRAWHEVFTGFICKAGFVSIQAQHGWNFPSCLRLAAAAESWEKAGEIRLCYQHLGLGVFENKAEPILGISGVQGDISATGFEYAQN